MNFNAVYSGRTRLGERPPWDIGEPQPEVIELERTGAIEGDVLDAGCGTGEHALHLAEKGHTVTGVDISSVAIARARGRAEERNLRAEFAVADAFGLRGYDGRFDTVVDCGLFDVCPGPRQRGYASALHRACRPGARVHMLELSAESTEYMRRSFVELGVPESRLAGLPRLVPADLRNAFTAGEWDELRLEEATMRVRMPGAAEITTVPALRATFRRR